MQTKDDLFELQLIQLQEFFNFIPGHRRFVETLRANLKNDPEFELVRLSDGNAVRHRSLV